MDVTSPGVRYDIQHMIGEGGMGIVYKVRDRLTGDAVALKRVNIPRSQLNYSRKGDLDSRVSLSQEFKFLASLRHPHIISVLDYGFDAEQQPYYTMELLQNAQTIVEYGSDLPFSRQIELLIQVLQALDYLHHRGIVHRDLKPENIMIVDGDVKVLDFGLAIAADYLDETHDDVAGTLAYMPPEILHGYPATPVADLYSFGLIAYELFYGEPAYSVKDETGITGLIQAIMYENPPVEKLIVPDSIRYIIQRATARNPEDRYPSAHALINRLAEATDQEAHYNTSEIRNSYLQAAHFVGRDDELAQLQQSMTDTFEGEGGGNCWLIGGTSGSGKSRMVEEVRVQALVTGAIVMRGQAIAEGGAPYQLWREVMRWLIILTPDMTDEQLGIAKEIVPDIDVLVNQPVPEIASPINPRAARDRLFSLFENLLCQQTRPIVILLEDLHWSVESLDVLRHILTFYETLPLFIVGTYRDDERPTLPDEVPDTHIMNLNQLQRDQVQQLSKAIIGETSYRSEVGEFIYEETEGNIFFIIELVRTLAEDAGHLKDIGLVSLPPDLIAGGIRQIINRRLSGLPEEARYLLDIAAVAGRYLDLDLLRHIAPEIDLDTALVQCSDVAILEVHETRWRFSHDKFREGILDNLSADDATRLNRQVAEATEALYPDDPTRIIPLFFLWKRTDNHEKACIYGQRAGEQAFQTSQYHESVNFLEQAYDLASTPEMRLKVLVQMVETTSLINPERMLILANQALELAQQLDDYQRLSLVYSFMARKALLRDSDLEKAGALQTRAIEAARQSGNGFAISEALRQLGNFELFQDRFESAFVYLAESVDVAREAGEKLNMGFALNSMSNGYGRRAEGDDLDKCRELAEEVVQIAQDVGNGRLLMMGVAHLGLSAIMRGDYESGYPYFMEAYELTRTIHDNEQMSKVNNYVAICEMNLAMHHESFNRFIEAIRQSKTNGIMPEIIRSMAGIAILWSRVGHKADAYKLMTYAYHHPLRNQETKKLLQDEYDALKTHFSDEECQAMDATAKSYELDDLIAQLIHNAQLEHSILGG